MSLPDVSLLLSQRGFCLPFFQEKKVDRTFLAIEGTPLLVPSHSWCAMALRHPLHGRFQEKVVPFFHRLCLVFLSSGHLSPPSCMPIAPLSAQLSFVFTLPDHSCPICLYCLGSLSKCCWSSPGPKATHRGATGSPALPLPSPTLELSLPDVSLLLS